jgi:hypothetical protein
MPNNNPSGANQPLNQHPLPLNYRYALGMDGRILENLVAATPYLLVEPGDAGVVREISPFGRFALHVGVGAADVTNIRFYLRDAQGLEYPIGTFAGPVAAGATQSFTWSRPYFLLGQEFTGAYVSFTGGAGGNIQLFGSWSDVRHVDAQRVLSLSQNPQNIYPDVPIGNAGWMPGNDQSPGAPLPTFNFDDIPHNVLYQLYDGQNLFDVETVTVGAAVVAGVQAAYAQGTDIASIPIPYGWELRATLQEALNGAGPVRTIQDATFTNQGPVRQDQGGAY